MPEQQLSPDSPGVNFGDLFSVRDEIATGAARATCELLVRGILTKEFRPGQHIIESHIAERAGVSRGTVRSALQILLARGLVTRRAQSGCFVVNPGLEEMCEIFDARACIEARAAQMMAQRRTCAHKRTLIDAAEASRTALEEEAFGTYGLLDVQFHIHVLHSCENACIADGINADALVIQTHISYPSALPLLGMPEGCTHMDIARAIDRGEDMKAREAMAEHIERSKQRLLRWSRQTGTNPASS